MSTGPEEREILGSHLDPGLGTHRASDVKRLLADVPTPGLQAFIIRYMDDPKVLAEIEQELGSRKGPDAFTMLSQVRELLYKRGSLSRRMPPAGDAATPLTKPAEDQGSPARITKPPASTASTSTTYGRSEPDAEAANDREILARIPHQAPSDGPQVPVAARLATEASADDLGQVVENRPSPTQQTPAIAAPPPPGERCGAANQPDVRFLENRKNDRCKLLGRGLDRPVTTGDSWRWQRTHLPPLAPAASDKELELHLAAIEWDLDPAILIHGAEDIQGRQHWSELLEPFEHQVRNLITFCRRAPVALIADDVGLARRSLQA